MSRAQKRKSIDEINLRREAITNTIMEKKSVGKVDIKSTFELMYLSLIPLLENRELVEDDLNELKPMLNACADRMLAIIKKSKAKTLK